MKTPPNPAQRDAVERLWRRAEEIRSLCGLPPFHADSGPPGASGPEALATLVDLLLRDLESNFRRELATRVQLEGLAELVAREAGETEPGRPYQVLTNYLARALDAPGLWLGILDGTRPTFALYRSSAGGADARPERVDLAAIDREWLRWITTGEGSGELEAGPSGSRRGGPWLAVPVRGDVPFDRLTAERPACPGSLDGAATCALSGGALEPMAGGHRACGRCQFGRLIALVGVEGAADPERRARLEAITPSLGAALANLALREGLDLEARFRERMEDQIRQLDRLAALGRFASSVAHELRSPLTGIATGVQYLSRGFPEDDERHDQVAFILREVVRLNTIIADLLNATRPRLLQLRPTPIADVVERSLRALLPDAEAAGVTIEREGADTWPTIRVDADQLQQVFLNLIQNAVQASPRGGVVTIRAHALAGPGTAVIEVEDRGEGIAPEHVARLFEPFYTTRPKGTGLGLFVAHGIVHRHGGAIEVESESGAGTRFRIVLPDSRA